jgi:hypothetical protein
MAAIFIFSCSKLTGNLQDGNPRWSTENDMKRHCEIPLDKCLGGSESLKGKSGLLSGEQARNHRSNSEHSAVLTGPT